MNFRDWSTIIVVLVRLYDIKATCMIKVEEAARRLNLLENLGEKFELTYGLLDKPNLYFGQIINELWTKALNLPNTCLVLPVLPFNVTQITDGNLISETESLKLFSALELSDLQIRNKLCANKNTTFCSQINHLNVTDENINPLAVVDGLLPNSIISSDSTSTDDRAEDRIEIDDLNVNCKQINVKNKASQFEAIDCAILNNIPNSTDIDITIHSLKITIT